MKSQPSSIDNPVVDPNFNAMRAQDAESSTATYIVVGLLVAATIILWQHGGISLSNFLMELDDNNYSKSFFNRWYKEWEK